MNSSQLLVNKKFGSIKKMSICYKEIHIYIIKIPAADSVTFRFNIFTKILSFCWLGCVVAHGEGRSDLLVDKSTEG